MVLNDNKKYFEANNAIKLGYFNIEKNNNTLNIPLYLAFLIKNTNNIA